MKCVDHCAAQDAGLGVHLSVRGMRHRLDALGEVETNKSWIRVCLASEREGEPRANDQVIFMFYFIFYLYVNFHEDIDSQEPYVLSTGDITFLYTGF